MEPETHVGTAAPTAAAESRNPFSSLGFAYWWLGSIIAGTGLGIQSVTVPLFIRDRVEVGARAFAISGALVAQTLPGAVLALVGGAVADRVERRRILVRTYALGALVSTTYVLLAGFDVRQIWPVFPLAALVGSAGAFTNPARQSLLNQLVTRAQLQNGVILGTMGFVATFQFLGPTLGGLLVGWRGLTLAFSAEVVLLSFGAAVFSRIRADHPVHSGRPVLHDLAEGLRYVRGAPAILGLLVLATVPGVLFIGPFAVTIAILVPDVLHASDQWVGILWGCFGIGVFLGSVLLTFRPIPRRGLAVCLANFVGGVVLVLYGLSHALALSAVLLVVWGFGASVFINYVVSLLQQHADPRMIGRVMSMYTLTFFVSMGTGYIQAGVVTNHFGPQTTLVASGMIAAVVGLLSALFWTPVRSLR